jgi:hypothetical protein
VCCCLFFSFGASRCFPPPRAARTRPAGLLLSARWRFSAPAFTLSGRQTASSGISRWLPESTRTGRRCRGEARRARRRNCTWGRRRAMLARQAAEGLHRLDLGGNSHIPGREALGLSFLRGGEEFLDLFRRWHPCSARYRGRRRGRRTPTTVVVWVVVGRFTRLLVAVVSRRPARRRRLSPELAKKIRHKHPAT